MEQLFPKKFSSRTLTSGGNKDVQLTFDDSLLLHITKTNTFQNSFLTSVHQCLNFCFIWRLYFTLTATLYPIILHAKLGSTIPIQMVTYIKYLQLMKSIQQYLDKIYL